jgi:hypothetical protein
LQPVDQDPWEINGAIDTQLDVFRFDLWAQFLDSRGQSGSRTDRGELRLVFTCFDLRKIEQIPH